MKCVSILLIRLLSNVVNVGLGLSSVIFFFERLHHHQKRQQESELIRPYLN